MGITLTAATTKGTADYVSNVLTSVRAKIPPNPNFIRLCRKYSNHWVPPSRNTLNTKKRASLSAWSSRNA